jgi:hypothetical protein
MTKTLLLAASIFAVLSFFMTSAAFAANPTGGHLDLTSSTFSGNTATITTAGSVYGGQPGAYGYGIVATNGIVGVTTHAGGDDSQRQANANQPSFHVHLVQAGAATLAQCPSGAQLIVTGIIDLDSNLKIKNKSIELTNIDTATSGTLTGPTVAFLLSFEAGGVCITPTDLI